MFDDEGFTFRSDPPPAEQDPEAQAIEAAIASQDDIIESLNDLNLNVEVTPARRPTLPAYPPPAPPMKKPPPPPASLLPPPSPPKNSPRLLTDDGEKASSLPESYSSPLTRSTSLILDDRRKVVQSCRMDTNTFEKISATKGFMSSKEPKVSIQLASSSNLISEVKGYLVEVPTEKADFETLLEPEPEFYRHKFYGHSQLLFCGEGPIIIAMLKKKAGNIYKAFVITKEGFDEVNIPVDKMDRVPEKTLERRAQVFFEKEYKCQLVKGDKSLSSAILKLEEEDPQKTRCVTFGVVYVKAGQTDEDDIFANVSTSPEYEEFLTYLGDKVTLCGWSGFRGGLDIKTNTKGTHSVFTSWNSFNIMYHVATLLPYNPKDKQQLERKNMIGNDIVTVIFLEGDEPYRPNTITSHMTHIIAVVRPKKNEKGVAGYELGIVFKDTIPPFAPPCPEFLEKGFVFRNFFLSKLMNGVITARRSQAFKRLFSIPRQAAMNEIIERVKTKKSKGSLLKMFG
eukprot:TRINITY_DN1983_c0_g1_i1.p1 TRINITY_DN1983_c0_g1~~TRINITY_DN1983_c0_g1_i1.p1  ORF type:complete len:510 (+),score=130.87 TRINITY_DN1983_c0_g1_i1:403-1932(+)